MEVSFRLSAETLMVLRDGLLSFLSRALILLYLSSSFPGLSLAAAAAVVLPASPLPGLDEYNAAVGRGDASKSISRRSKGTK